MVKQYNHMVENYPRMDGTRIILKSSGRWKKNRRKPVLEQNKQFCRYATVFLSVFFFAWLIGLFSLETLCLFSDSVNCSYRLWAWVTFYRPHSEKVDPF